jgi:SAM-dependent methyltransferase
MSFEVSTDAYARFMGRFSRPLAAQLVELVGVRRGQTALDVGCGTGALTELLVDELGIDAVQAVDPSESFVAAMRVRWPALDVQRCSAESLPHATASFDRTLASLVVHFMTDPVQGLAEMARVTAPGGAVAATVWDHAGSRGPLHAFWVGVNELDPGTYDEAHLPGAREGHLHELFAQAGMADATSTTLTVEATLTDFDAWWEPYTLGVGPAGAYVAGLDDARRRELREHLRASSPDGSFTMSADAWTVVWSKPA